MSKPMIGVGLCQEAVPRSEWPYRQDWIAKEVKRADSVFYPVWVVGTNLNDGSEFAWNVPLPLSWRYDLTNAVIDPALT